MTLSDLLVAELAAYAFVFCRLGAALMFMPGFGDSTVNVRTRLLLAIAIAIALGKTHGAPEMLLSGFWPAATAIAAELTVGVFLGLAGRLAIAALQTAGSVIAAQISLANALSFDAISAQQGALPANFLTMLGVVLLFVTDLHHLLLMGVAASYETFPPGVALPTDGFAEVIATLVAEGFAIGLSLAAPFVLVGITVTIGMGVLSRLMPQVQVFFIVMPLQIAVGLGLFALTLGAGMRLYMERFVEMQSLVVFGG
jgi:flagellar biosynthetic protein FliR